MLRLEKRLTARRWPRRSTAGGFLVSELLLVLVVLAVLAAVIMVLVPDGTTESSSAPGAIRPVRNFVVTGSDDRFVGVLTDRDCYVHDLSTGLVTSLWWREADDRITVIAGSPTQPQILLGNQEGMASLFDVADDRVLWQVDAEIGQPLSAEFSSDGTQVAIGTELNEIVILDAVTGVPRHRFQGTVGISALSFSPDGTQIIAAESTEAIAFWNIATGRVVRRLECPTQSVSALAISPDGASLAAATSLGTTHIWDLATGRETQRLGNADLPTLAVTWSPTTGNLLRGSATGQITETGDRGQGEQEWTAHQYGVREITYVRGWLVSAGYDGRLRPWDAERKAMSDLERGVTLPPRATLH